MRRYEIRAKLRLAKVYVCGAPPIDDSPRVTFLAPGHAVCYDQDTARPTFIDGRSGRVTDDPVSARYAEESPAYWTAWRALVAEFSGQDPVAHVRAVRTSLINAQLGNASKALLAIAAVSDRRLAMTVTGLEVPFVPDAHCVVPCLPLVPAAGQPCIVVAAARPRFFVVLVNSVVVQPVSTVIEDDRSTEVWTNMPDLRQVASLVTKWTQSTRPPRVSRAAEMRYRADILVINSDVEARAERTRYMLVIAGNSGLAYVGGLLESLPPLGSAQPDRLPEVLDRLAAYGTSSTRAHETSLLIIACIQALRRPAGCEARLLRAIAGQSVYPLFCDYAWFLERLGPHLAYRLPEWQKGACVYPEIVGRCAARYVPYSEAQLDAGPLGDEHLPGWFRVLGSRRSYYSVLGCRQYALKPRSGGSCRTSAAFAGSFQPTSSLFALDNTEPMATACVAIDAHSAQLVPYWDPPHSSLVGRPLEAVQATESYLERPCEADLRAVLSQPGPPLDVAYRLKTLMDQRLAEFGPQSCEVFNFWQLARPPSQSKDPLYMLAAVLIKHGWLALDVAASAAACTPILRRCTRLSFADWPPTPTSGEWPPILRVDAGFDLKVAYDRLRSQFAAILLRPSATLLHGSRIAGILAAVTAGFAPCCFPDKAYLRQLRRATAAPFLSAEQQTDLATALYTVARAGGQLQGIPDLTWLSPLTGDGIPPVRRARVQVQRRAIDELCEVLLRTPPRHADEAVGLLDILARANSCFDERQPDVFADPEKLVDRLELSLTSYIQRPLCILAVAAAQEVVCNNWHMPAWTRNDIGRVVGRDTVEFRRPKRQPALRYGARAGLRVHGIVLPSTPAPVDVVCIFPGAVSGTECVVRPIFMSARHRWETPPPPPQMSPPPPLPAPTLAADIPSAADLLSEI